MKWKIWLLPVFLGGALSMIYFLPSAGEVAGTAVKMELPGTSGRWILKKIPPSKEELGALAKDTEFSKAICLAPRPGEISEDGKYIPDRVDLSIVLSGYDLNNSIHRPERCMPAQGHTNLSSSDVKLKLGNGRELSMRRLRSTQHDIQISADRTQDMELSCVTYYFFVGHDRVVHDHLERTLVDMKDRLIRGMDQRWAYVSASMWYGKLPWIESEVTEQEADAKLQAFLAELVEKQVEWERIIP